MRPLLGPSVANATSITFGTSGSNSDGPLSATALFTTSNGVLTVTLTDTTSISSLRGAGQALSDIQFTLSNAPGTLGATTASGQLGTVSSSGVVTYTTGSPVRFLGQGPAPPGGSGFFNISGDTITMEAIGGGQPSEMIIPALANGGTYTDVNKGFKQFDPYTIGPATFTLDLSGVTASTTVTAATFSFGTGPDTYLPGTPTTTTPTPEPSSLLLGFTGMGLLAGALKLRRQSFS